MTYQITDYTKNKAKLFNVLVKPSNKKFYKIDVYDLKNNYITSIGDRRYKDFPTYIKEEGMQKALERKRLYYIRHKKDVSKIGSRGYYAGVLLW